ncbi:hypothetical protein MIDIC_510006 [Alphaproteobacteria bacterium]
MNRTLKEATVNNLYVCYSPRLKEHLHAYLMAYNFAKRLKSLKGNTPWQFVINNWAKHPEYFNINPLYFLVELNN